MKFLLHWWYTSADSESNKRFFQDIVRIGGSKILHFPFAQKNKEYQLQYDLDIKKFKTYNPDTTFEFSIASTDIDILTQQIIDHPVLYFCGWNTLQHIELVI